MSATSTRAGARKGTGSRAAKAEQAETKTMRFAGLKIELPPKLPASFAYRFAQITSLEERNENAAGKVYDLLVNVIGAEQFDHLCDHIDETEAEVSLVDLIVELINEYQAEPGE